MLSVGSIADQARRTPEKAAVILGGSGTSLTYAELDAAANRGAHVLRAAGVAAGDAIAMCLENGYHFFNVAWALMRCGAVVVPISARLTAKEIAFIVEDSDAKMLITSPGIDADLNALAAMTPHVIRFAVGMETPGYRHWEAETDAASADAIVDEGQGSTMLYSSGTTGRPKGIHRRSTGGSGGAFDSTLRIFGMLGLDHSMVYLSPAPLYHSAPFLWSMATGLVGGTVVIMERFDAEQALGLIERYRVTIGQWVPTHFVRLLKLDEATRRSHDLSSLKLAVHAAAPCPVPVKREMIDWWGPILFEYFGSTEQSALTFITSDEWLTHPGSVGRCRLGKLHICDDSGEPVPTGTTGQVYSEGGLIFDYHKDPEKTAQSRNRFGWTTVGDMGYLDQEGYLYLTDRKNFMIISGGVNVYPQEIENVLVTHPKVADVAVIGTPHPDLGEQVTAIVQPVYMADATPAFAETLKSWVRSELSGVKVPKRIEFRETLPRLPTGKMVKHTLRQEYS
jgi:acyl-CoA synthetase (AMP-forming)/AMP-acid ligase II